MPEQMAESATLSSMRYGTVTQKEPTQKPIRLMTRDDSFVTRQSEMTKSSSGEITVLSPPMNHSASSASSLMHSESNALPSGNTAGILRVAHRQTAAPPTGPVRGSGREGRSHQGGPSRERDRDRDGRSASGRDREKESKRGERDREHRDKDRERVRDGDRDAGSHHHHHHHHHHHNSSSQQAGTTASASSSRAHASSRQQRDGNQSSRGAGGRSAHRSNAGTEEKSSHSRGADRDRDGWGDEEFERGSSRHYVIATRNPFSNTPPAGQQGAAGDNASSYAGGSVAAADHVGSGIGGGGQLFDPRRHDPVKFAMLKRSGDSAAGSIGSGPGAAGTTGTMTPTTYSDVSRTTPHGNHHHGNGHGSLSVAGKSFISATTASASTAPSVSSSEASRDRRRRRGPASASASSAQGDSQASRSEGRSRGAGGGQKQGSVGGSGGDGGGGEVNSYVMDLKRTYRDITQLEQKLQDEHKAAAEKRQASGETSQPAIVGAKGANGVGAKDGGIDHDAWLALTAQHRQLAELHEAFMDMALRPGLPASLHSLPQNYNIPTRLWQMGFHLMLERLRHALPNPQVNHPPQDAQGALIQAQLLDHLTEFIYFAYLFYSHLLESEVTRQFKNAWTESLGDLARYRMAVAGLSAALNASQRRGALIRNKAPRPLVRQGPRDGEGEAAATPPTAAETRRSTARIDDDHADAGGAASDREIQAAPAQAQRPRRGEDLGLDGASIGSDALGDWELEEKETWRITATDWYAKGLVEMPGTGRLHHHLGILNRTNELRGLHHFCRSLTASHPFASARESLLPLFDQKLQANRQCRDASITDLFVAMHGMLITRVQLDDFDEVFERFIDALHQMDPSGRMSPSNAGSSNLTQATWTQMAAINVSSLLQYGAEDAVFASPDSSEASPDQQRNSRRTERSITKVVPTAIMLSKDQQPASPTRSDSKALASTQEENGTVVDLQPKAAPILAEEDLPITLQYALRLTFAMLKSLLENSAKASTSQNIPNSYITVLLTFLATVAKQPHTIHILSRWVPWEALTRLATVAPHAIDPRKPIPGKITSNQPLPEDWCLRGMAWVGRRVYERGFWKGQRTGPPMLHYESEVDVLTREEAMAGGDWAGESITSEGDDEPATAVSRADAMLAELRWKRITYGIVSLAKTVPGLDYDARKEAITITEPLRSKIDQRAREEQEQANVGKQTAQPCRTFETDSDEESDSSSDGDGGEADADLPDDIRELKARRRYLKNIIKQAKNRHIQLSRTPAKPKASKQQAKTKRTKQAASKSKPLLNVVPGYSTLVLDTNILIAPDNLLKQLVESKQWTIIIPLVVVTELDGLQKNATPTGAEAKRSLGYLEKNIRALSKWIKVQTSRGNYLADLNVRAEEIDFGGEDDDSRARSLDEIILRNVIWQQSNFVDRLAILSDNPARDREKVQEDTPKAVLITLDRNLRLKARAKGLLAATPKDMANILLTQKAPDS